MTPDIVTLGCSFTAEGLPDTGWVSFLRKKYPKKLITNLAQPGRGNPVQSIMMNNMIYDMSSLKKLNRTTLIWQIASPTRPLCPYNHNFGYEEETNCLELIGDAEVKPLKWKPLFLGTQHPFILENNGYLVNEELNLRELVCDIVKWSYFVKNIIVVLGWSNMYKKYGDNEISKDFLTPLENHANIIPLIKPEEAIVDYVKENNGGFDETEHPTTEGYKLWFDGILNPVLNKVIGER